MRRTVVFKDVCEFRKGRKPNKYYSEPVAGSLPYILIESFDGSRTSFTDDTNCVRCTEEDTLIVCDGARTGLSAIGNAGYIGSTIAALVPDKTQILPRFLFYFIRNNFNLINTTTRGAAVPHIDRTLLMSLSFILPPLSEQERIVRLLDQSEALRKLRSQVNTRMEEFVPALFYEMFGKSSNKKNSWKLVSLMDVVEGKYGIKAGPFGSSIKKETYKPSGYKVYGQEQVIADDFTIGTYFIDEAKFQELKTCEVKSGDVLISLVGTFGKISVVPDGIQPGIINPRLLKITPNQKLISSLFLKILLESNTIQTQLNHFAGGGTMGVLNASILKRLTFPLPALDLQHEFAERVREAREVQSVQVRSEEKVEALYQSMLDRAFKGEL